MKKLLPLFSLLLLLGCETPSLEIKSEIPELPTGEETEISEELTEDYETIAVDPTEYWDLVFYEKDLPFATVSTPSSKCNDEDYLEENSSEILVAEATTVQSGVSRLNVIEWIKGDPQAFPTEMEFTNDNSNAPEFEKGLTYKIFLSDVDGTYQVTCDTRGIIEL